MSAPLSETEKWPFDTVLVANRGEIAVRVLRTVQKLGLKGVVVYHAADRGTLAVKMTAVAIEIPGTPPVAASLDGAHIIAAPQPRGAVGLAPRSGFLSHNKWYL